MTRPGYSWTTYPERLQAAGVNWKVYQVAADNFGDNALALFNQYSNAKPGNPLYDRGMASVPTTSGNTVDDIAAAIPSDVLARHPAAGVLGRGAGQPPRSCPTTPPGRRRRHGQQGVDGPHRQPGRVGLDP